MASIPLLKFPIIIIEDILKQITPLELVRLSVCSTNLRLFIAKQKCVMNWTFFPKDVLQSFDCIEFLAFLQINMRKPRFYRDNDLVMEINLSNLKIYIGESSKSFRFISKNIAILEKYVPRVKYMTFLNKTVPCLFHKKKLCTFWNNKMDGFKTLISFFVKTYNLKVELVTLTAKNEMIHKTRDLALTNWMRSVGLKAGSCCQITIETTREKGDYSFPLDVLEPSNDSNLAETKIIELYHSHWFKIDNLLSFNFEGILLEKSEITSAQLRVFVNQWLEGKFPRLKHLRVENPNINICEILHNLAVTPKHDKHGREYISYNGFPRRINEARDLLRHDGVLATIPYPRSSFSPNEFEFLVWPDCDGNYL